MRLERHDEPTTSGEGSGRDQIRCQLGRVMRIRVVDAHTVGGALELHPPARAPEGREAGDELAEGVSEQQTRGERCGSVQRVVPTGHDELDDS